MRKISESDHIPFSQKIAFSLGVNTDYFATGIMMTVLWMPFFNIGKGMNPTVLGIILMVFVIWDALTDPVMGYISDNARTRWGRRRPFMVIGSILTAGIYPLFWYMPDSLGESARIIYLIVVGLLFFTCYTIWAMPYYGLQLELTPNYDERTRLAAYLAVFGKLSALCGGWVLALATGSWLTAGTGDITVGMRYVCWWICGLILVCGLLPAVFVKERYYDAEAKWQKKVPLTTSLKDSFSCGPLWILIGISFFLVLGAFSVRSIGQYVNIYYIFGGNISEAAVLEGWKGTATVVFGVAMVPFWTWIGEKLAKKKMIILLMAFAMFGHLLNFICMNPEAPFLQLIPAIFESGSLSAMWIFLPSMKADVADFDELTTHQRREGSLNAFYSLFFKAALTGAMGVGGYVLDLSGFSASLAVQPPEVLARMFHLFLILPCFSWILALILAGIYPLSRNRMAEIRQTLEAQRGAL
jgi:GPH family glycoside/pentoside/hexuronide:cation symporter